MLPFIQELLASPIAIAIAIAIAILLIIRAVLWFILPFSIFGIKPKINQLIDKAGKTNELLKNLKGEIQVLGSLLNDIKNKDL